MSRESLRFLLRFLLKSLLVAAVAFVVVTFFLSMALGAVLFFYTPYGIAVSQLGLQRLVVSLFVIFEFELPLRLSAGGLFMGLWIVYIVCLVAAWAGPKKRFEKALETSFTGSVRDAFASPMFVIPVLASMLLDLVLVIQGVQEAAGVPTGSIELSDPFMALLSLAYAPVMETIGFRLTPIGFFLVPYLLWKGRQRVAVLTWSERIRSALEAFLAPDSAKSRLGLPTVVGSGVRKGVTLPEWFVVAGAAIGFGLAHILSGSGWEAGKVSTAALAGFVFGVVYLTYGVHAAIIMHWFFDYYFMVYALADEMYSGLFLMVDGLVNSVILWLGLAGWAAVVALGVLRVVRKIRPPRAPLPPPTVPPPAGVRYCLFCGSTIRWDSVFCTECSRKQELPSS